MLITMFESYYCMFLIMSTVICTSPGKMGKVEITSLRPDGIMLLLESPINDERCPISEYIIEYLDGFCWIVAKRVPVRTTVVILDLPERSYIKEFRVKAKNDIGFGPPYEVSSSSGNLESVSGHYLSNMNSIWDEDNSEQDWDEKDEETRLDLVEVLRYPDYDLKRKREERIRESEERAREIESKRRRRQEVKIVDVSITETATEGRYRLKWSTSSEGEDFMPNEGYIIELLKENDEWLKLGEVDGQVTAVEIGNLQNGCKYKFRITGFNGNRLGECCSGKLFYYTSSKEKLSKPREVTAEIWDRNYIVVRWKEPEHDGGLTITQYGIFGKQGKNEHWIALKKVDGDTFATGVSNKKESITFQIVVTVKNVAEQQVNSDAVTVDIKSRWYDWRTYMPSFFQRKKDNKPGRPMNFRVTNLHDNLVDIAWETPVDDAIFGYVVEYCIQRDRRIWLQKEPIIGNVLSTTIKCVITDYHYQLRIRAVNKNGIGEFSNESDKINGCSATEPAYKLRVECNVKPTILSTIRYNY